MAYRPTNDIEENVIHRNTIFESQNLVSCCTCSYCIKRTEDATLTLTNFKAAPPIVNEQSIGSDITEFSNYMIPQGTFSGYVLTPYFSNKALVSDASNISGSSFTGELVYYPFLKCSGVTSLNPTSWPTYEIINGDYTLIFKNSKAYNSEFAAPSGNRAYEFDINNPYTYKLVEGNPILLDSTRATDFLNQPLNMGSGIPIVLSSSSYKFSDYITYKPQNYAGDIHGSYLYMVAANRTQFGQPYFNNISVYYTAQTNGYNNTDLKYSYYLQSDCVNLNALDLSGSKYSKLTTVQDCSGSFYPWGVTDQTAYSGDVERYFNSGVTFGNYLTKGTFDLTKPEKPVMMDFSQEYWFSLQSVLSLGPNENTARFYNSNFYFLDLSSWSNTQSNPDSFWVTPGVSSPGYPSCTEQQLINKFGANSTTPKDPPSSNIDVGDYQTYYDYINSNDYSVEGFKSQSSCTNNIQKIMTPVFFKSFDNYEFSYVHDKYELIEAETVAGITDKFIFPKRESWSDCHGTFNRPSLVYPNSVWQYTPPPIHDAELKPLAEMESTFNIYKKGYVLDKFKFNANGSFEATMSIVAEKNYYSSDLQGFWDLKSQPSYLDLPNSAYCSYVDHKYNSSVSYNGFPYRPYQKGDYNSELIYHNKFIDGYPTTFVEYEDQSPIGYYVNGVFSSYANGMPLTYYSDACHGYTALSSTLALPVSYVAQKTDRTFTESKTDSTGRTTVTIRNVLWIGKKLLTETYASKFDDVHFDGSISSVDPVTLGSGYLGSTTPVYAYKSEVVTPDYKYENIVINGNISGGGVTSYNVVDGGYGIEDEPIISVVGSVTSEINASITPFIGVNSKYGTISKIVLNNPDYNGQYKSPPTITFTPPPEAVQATAIAILNKQATAHVTKTTSSGGVAEIKMLNQGSGYFDSATLKVTSFTYGGGSGAKFSASISGGKVTAINIDKSGSGYAGSDDPMIIIEPSTRSNDGPWSFGVVAMVDSGFGYTSVPNVTIQGDSKAYAVIANNHKSNSGLSPIEGTVTSIVVTDAGSGYTKNASVTIDPPPPTKAAEAHFVLGTGSKSGTVVSVVLDDPGSGYFYPTVPYDVTVNGETLPSTNGFGKYNFTISPNASKTELVNATAKANLIDNRPYLSGETGLKRNRVPLTYKATLMGGFESDIELSFQSKPLCSVPFGTDRVTRFKVSFDGYQKIPQLNFYSYDYIGYVYEATSAISWPSASPYDIIYAPYFKNVAFAPPTINQDGVIYLKATQLNKYSFNQVVKEIEELEESVEATYTALPTRVYGDFGVPDRFKSCLLINGDKSVWETGNEMVLTGISLVITNPGSGYTSTPTIKITGGGGTDARAYAVINYQNKLTDIVIINQGTGYTSERTIEVIGGGGSGAEVEDRSFIKYYSIFMEEIKYEKQTAGQSLIRIAETLEDAETGIYIENFGFRKNFKNRSLSVKYQHWYKDVSRTNAPRYEEFNPNELDYSNQNADERGISYSINGEYVDTPYNLEIGIYGNNLAWFNNDPTTGNSVYPYLYFSGYERIEVISLSPMKFKYIKANFESFLAPGNVSYTINYKYPTNDSVYQMYAERKFGFQCDITYEEVVDDFIQESLPVEFNQILENVEYIQTSNLMNSRKPMRMINPEQCEHIGKVIDRKDCNCPKQWVRLCDVHGKTDWKKCMQCKDFKVSE